MLKFSIFITVFIFHLLCQFLNLVDNVDNVKNYILFLHCTIKCQCDQGIYLYIAILDELVSVYPDFFAKVLDIFHFYLNYRISWFEKTLGEHTSCILMTETKWDINMNFTYVEDETLSFEVFNNFTNFQDGL